MAPAASTFRMPDKIPSRRTKTRHSQGFTLLEIILTILLLILGVIALSQAMSTGMLASTDAENVDLALNIAQTKMETIKNTAFSGIASNGPTADANFPNFSTTVTVTGTDPKQVDVTVAWNVQGGSTNVGLTTLVANY